ncbi:MAG: HAD-IC family P-type ATPase [Clostridia bacterium]|nr:HAD-IC family P-type ATPase [Clostridia bacterium]
MIEPHAGSSIPPVGLTSAQVKLRQKNGQANTFKSTVSKPISRILLDNIATPFNFFNVLIGAALLYAQSYVNLLFFIIILANTAVGIFQELRSKRTLEKLSLLSASKARVIRDGETQEIPLNEIVLDDTILFQIGNQIPVDARVCDGEMEVNESLLTGELTPIVKRPGDELLSGSFVVSGHAVATVEHVGADAYAARITAEAKKYKRFHSKLMDAINRIIRFTGFFIPPFGALLILTEALAGRFQLSTIITKTAGALLGMMPQGLVLLTTVSLTVGVIRLAKKHVLVQQLYSIEALSRVDTLCLDKTGTLTEGHMQVSHVHILDESPLPQDFAPLMLTAVKTLDDRNATADAMASYFAASADELPLVEVARSPFSSSRKWSAISFEGVGSVFFGAHDRLLPEGTALPEDILAAENEGKRLLLIAYSPSVDLEEARQSLWPIAMLTLEDRVRENAPEILRFFEEEGVDIRIISGDHPATVSAIARAAGVKSADNVVDAGTLTTPEAIADAASRYTVFGRVLPSQKKQLIQAMKAAGHIVAMTGDGVNDVPALKEADCSVAMAAGSDAAKQVSQLVLLHSDFAALPQTLMEGRRVVNNITRTASLFLVKTMMSFLIAVLAIVTPMPYPFEPIQLTLIGVFAESIPGFLLTLQPSRERVRDDFLKQVFCNAFPSALLITAMILLIELLLAPWLGLSSLEAATLCAYITGFIWLVQLLRVCRPLNAVRGIMWGAMFAGLFGGYLLLGAIGSSLVSSGILSTPVVVWPTLSMWIAFVSLGALAYPLEQLAYRATHHILYRKRRSKSL